MSDDQKLIHPIHTPCKECVFAIYDDKTQTGCHLEFIDKYQKSDVVDVLEAYDENKNFYVISGKKCSGYREQKYFDAREMSNASIEEKILHVNDKIKLKYLAVIDCMSRTPEDLKTVLSQISSAKIKPEMIMLVTYSKNKEHTFEDFYKVLNKSKIGCKWKIKGLALKEQNLITTVHQSINIGAENCNFVLAVGNDYTNVAKIIDTANRIVYDEFKRFSVISNKSKETILFNQFVYKAALNHKSDIITNYQDYIII